MYVQLSDVCMYALYAPGDVNTQHASSRVEVFMLHAYIFTGSFMLGIYIYSFTHQQLSKD